MTEEDIKQIQKMIDAANEQVVLSIPKLIGKLTMDRMSMVSSVKELYKDNPEWKNHTGAVQDVLEKTEAENPGLPYLDLVKKAKPEIDKRIKTLSVLDYDKKEKPIGSMFKGNVGEV